MSEFAECHELVLVKIFPLSEGKITSDYQAGKPLEVDGKPVKFLKQPLLESTHFKELDSSHYHHLWLLRFFADSASEVQLVVALRELSASYLEKTSFEKLSPREKEFQVVDSSVQDMFYAVSDNASQHILVRLRRQNREDSDVPETAINIVSRWLRGSDALKSECFTRRSGHSFAVDGQGIGFITYEAQDEKDKSQFYRILLLFALAQAYKIAIDQLTNKLATSCNDVAKLRSLYHNTLIFNARYFFRYPVRLERVELPEIWEQIHSRFALSELNAELIEQTNAIRNILDEEVIRQEAERSRRINFRLSLLSTVIGILSLLTLVEVTPTMLADFYTAWSDLLISIVNRFVP